MIVGRRRITVADENKKEPRDPAEAQGEPVEGGRKKRLPSEGFRRRKTVRGRRLGRLFRRG
jgi:hypothetical protein